MSFAILWLPDSAAQYAKIRGDALAGQLSEGKSKSNKAQGLFKQVHKCIQQLSVSPRHPGLKTHEYHGMPHPFDENQKVFEAYAQNRTPGAYRVFWCYGPGRNQITIIAITPHP
jgi:hypothetical protein